MDSGDFAEAGILPIPKIPCNPSSKSGGVQGTVAGSRFARFLNWDFGGLDGFGGFFPGRNPAHPQNPL
jgi:hypothetical protein